MRAFVSRRSALCTLANIVAGNAHQVDSVVGLQVLPVVADLLLSSRFPSIRTEACRLVTNVASEGVTHVQAVVSCTKLVAALLSALSETETIEVRAEAAKAVGAAASSGSPEQIGLFVDAGFIGPMCDMLLVRWGGGNEDDDGDDTILYIIEGLEMILHVGEVQSRSCGSRGNNRMTLKLVEAAGFSKIRNLHRRSSDCSGEVQDRVAAILETYFDTETAVVGKDEAAAATL
jgi:importin subunit alpha-6/7